VDDTARDKDGGAMTPQQQQLEWRGMKVVDPSGANVGTLDEIYFDADTDRPAWAAVKTGLFGSHLSFVPLAGASSDGEQVRVAYEKVQIKDAPHADAEEQLSIEDEDRLYRHYGVSYSEPRSGAGRDPAARNASTDDAMTRSEEELEIKTSKRTAGRVRLRKFVDEAWLVKHPRITLHFTPTSGSWLNLVEVFFSIITRQAIRRGTFASVAELVGAIRRFIDGWNDRCHPFIWTKTADEILPHATRQATSDARH